MCYHGDVGDILHILIYDNYIVRTVYYNMLLDSGVASGHAGHAEHD